MKKAISLLTIAVLGIASVTPGFAANKANTPTRATVSSYVSPYKTTGKSAFASSKLAKLQPQVLANMRKLEKNALAPLSADTKKEYKRMLDALIKETQALFSEAKLKSYYVDEVGVTQKVTAKVAEFNALISEITSLPKGAAPFTISAEEKTSVEGGITTMQKDLLVPLIEKALKNYKESDLKETGEFHTSVEYKSGKFSLDLNRYTSILSVLGLSQEVDFAAKFAYEMQVPTMGTFDKETGKYTPGAPTTASGSVSADINVKMIDSKLYLLVRNATVNIAENDSLGITKSDIQQIRDTLATMQGKTYVMDIPKSEGEMNSAKLLANITKTVDVLSTDSLFTPKRKIGDSYALATNPATLKKIADIYSETPSGDKVSRTAKDLNLFYGNTAGVETLTAKIQETTAYGTAVLTKKNGVYDFAAQIDGRGYSTGNVYTLTASKGKFNMLFKEARSSSEVSVKWENETLLMTVTEDGKEAFKASGALSEKKADLTFLVMGKSFGTFKMDTVGVDEYTYSLVLASEASTEIPMMFKFKMSGKSKLESGKFPITTPTDTTPIEELNKKASSIK